ncbi:MAG: hypothetical protein IJS95_02750 [Prevotella sp.]|nr:hypothetical protein [Prevotella sp.]
MIDVHNISFKYKGQKALVFDGFSLQLEENRISFYVLNLVVTLLIPFHYWISYKLFEGAQKGIYEGTPARTLPSDAAVGYHD